MEHCHQIGETGDLFGIVNHPEGVNNEMPWVIFINAGFLHHVGPYRMYTLLTRRLASVGIASVRFDLAGLGDSNERSGVPDIRSDEHGGAIADVRTVMDFVQAHYGANRFVTCGLCSGADDALHVATDDDRVVGAFMIDGPGFRTRRYYVHHYLSHYLRRVFSLQKWRVLLDRHFGGGDTGQAGGDLVGDFDTDFRDDMNEAKLRDMVASLTNRGCKLHFLYTGGVTDYYNYDRQFRDMFGSQVDGDLLSSSYHPHSDHLFYLESHRKQAVTGMLDWLQARYRTV
jgi:pimeloyl-ACP methyl ester carboxylesterase